MLTHIKAFRLVYETRSFSAAAAQLFVTQPTVSNQIKQLEEQLQVQLFQRRGNRDVHPTAAADVLYSESTKLLADWQQTERKLVAAKQQKTQTVVISASQTTALTLLPNLLPKLNQQFPQIAWRVKMTNSEQVLKELKAHRVQFGLVEKPVAASGIERVALMPDQLVCAGQATGLWLTRERGSGTFEYTQRYLKEAGIVPEQQLEIDNLNLILRLLQRGMGQTVLSERLVPDSIPTRSLGERFKRCFYLVYARSDWGLNPDLAAICQQIQTLTQSTRC
ncbi:LysR family transcriptional regulator [Lactiplantibacillus plajomi]|uniref:LysR substrate-binding domain-containing protein n=1 Tax=Lactiplantibacillus plajomi TaxID=1457217 RepID=A0ABV6K398_9LACO|nr:LysR family transcriptional regulator [Lactiplantibacillus plajomi]